MRPRTERILLVDDDVELCEILTEYFAGEGFEVEARMMVYAVLSARVRANTR